jgi:hypothetical protein
VIVGWGWHVDGKERREGFRLRLTGELVIKLRQGFKKPKPMTVFGDAPLDLLPDDDVGHCRGSDIVDVTSATA